MAGSNDFVHLHLHTEYSLLDGATRASEVAARAAEWDMPAVALTDHGSLYGAVPFYLACVERGVKPILGVEAYVVPDGSRTERARSGRSGKELCHFTLLAENETGWRNLLKMVSDSWLNGFYYKPRMDHELLAAHHEGLIAMSACLGGEIPQAILAGQRDEAVRTALMYREMFGPSHFFLELMQHHTEEDRIVNQALVEISRETGIPLVATNDVHYLNDSDAEPQDLLLCIQTGCLRSDQKRMRMSSRELYFRSAEQMWELFGELPDALLRTREIAERCELELRFGDFILPEFPVPDGETPASYLRRLCFERVGNFYQPVTDEIRARLDYELRIIDDKGYTPYFLIVWDLIDYAKRHGMRVGPGRGSAAGSMVAYVLGITELDPLRYGLFFERFLNPERPSAPDIDIDFPPERRDEVVAYTIEKYGPTHTAKIITFGTLGARAAIKDVGRVMEMPIAEVNELSSMVPDRVNVTLSQAIEEVEELRRRYETDPQVHELIDAALRLEGLARHSSIHAAALVIARDPLDHHVPLCRVSSGDDIVTQFDMDAIDKIGLLKMDFLSLRTMTVIEEACRLVRERLGDETFDVRNVPLDDPATYELIGRGDVVGVFQLESSGFQRVCRDMKPDCIEDLVALVALYRPGPMKYIDDYIARKHGRQPVTYRHPLLEPILRSTYGIIVYQEQVMQIGRDLAGFSLGQADLIRKAVGKKDTAAMAKVRRQFIAGCRERGIDEDIAAALMDDIEEFADYAFNKAHSACYAVISYWTAYLKANHPVEFMAAQLTSVMDRRDKLVTFIHDTRAAGIEVRPPCVNAGGVRFEVHDDHIFFGLGGINGVGVSVAEAIVAERQANGPYRDLFDLCERLGPHALPKAVVEKLIKAGACGSFGNRKQLLDAYEAVHEAAARARQDRESGQQSLFDGLEDAATSEVLAPRLKAMAELDRDTLRELDLEMLGVVLFENPHGEMHRQLAQVKLPLTRVGEVGELADGAVVVLGGMLEECVPITTRNGDAMMRARLTDGRDSVTLWLFPRTYSRCKEVAETGRTVIVVGKVKAPDASRNERQTSVAVERLLPCTEWRKAAKAAGQQTPPAREPTVAPNGNGAATTDPTFGSVAAVDVRMQLGPDLRERLAALAEALGRHRGEVPVVLWLENGAGHRRLRLGADHAITWSRELIDDLGRISGCTVRPVE